MQDKIYAPFNKEIILGRKQYEDVEHMTITIKEGKRITILELNEIIARELVDKIGNWLMVNKQ